MKILERLAFLFFFTALIYSCSSGKEEEKSVEEEIGEEMAKSDTGQVEVSQEIIDELIYSIPSPLELTSAIRASGAKYTESVLNPYNNAGNYVDNHKKALNLGVYGADMGYINIYEQNLATVSYMSSIKRIANDLKVGQFFDLQTIKRLSAMKENIDSLLMITTTGFSKMDSYLREQERSNISVMIATGTWVEGMYILTQITKDAPTEELISRIGEQKTTLDNLLLILNVFKNDAKIQALVPDFEELKAAYTDVEIIITYGEPTSREVDGKLVIEDNSNSEVKVTDEQLANIIEMFAALRSKIIS
jgi:hypothetical protein